MPVHLSLCLGFARKMSSELLNLLEPVDMVVRHHETEHHVKKYGRYLQGHGPSKGLRNQNMTGSTISSELFLLYLLNDSFASKLWMMGFQWK